MIIADAIAEFRRLHSGRDPAEIVVTPAASVIMSVQEKLPAHYDGVNVRVTQMPHVVPAGKGTRIILCASNLPGGRVGVVACESDAEPSASPLRSG